VRAYAYVTVLLLEEMLKCSVQLHRCLTTPRLDMHGDCLQKITFCAVFYTTVVHNMST